MTKVFKLLYFISSLLVITVIGFIPLQEALVFEPKQMKQDFVYLPLKNDSPFQIKYTHSIHLSDVVESYQVTSDMKIKQYELMYEDFSIGMPSNAEGDEIFEQKDGKYYISNMNRILPNFILRTGQVRANHRVIYEEVEYPLARFIKPGTSVKVEIQNLNLFQLWKGVNILE